MHWSAWPAQSHTWGQPGALGLSLSRPGAGLVSSCPPALPWLWALAWWLCLHTALSKSNAWVWLPALSLPCLVLTGCLVFWTLGWTSCSSGTFPAPCSGTLGLVPLHRGVSKSSRVRKGGMQYSRQFKAGKLYWSIIFTFFIIGFFNIQ